MGEKKREKSFDLGFCIFLPIKRLRKNSPNKMGKTKHKKHHRHEDGDGEEAGDDATNAGSKLVLKVGSKGHEKHKKKKKKKDKKKERDKDRKHHHHHHHKEKKLDSDATNDPEIKTEVKIEDPDEESPKKALTRLLEQML